MKKPWERRRVYARQISPSEWHLVDVCGREEVVAVARLCGDQEWLAEMNPSFFADSPILPPCQGDTPHEALLGAVKYNRFLAREIDQALAKVQEGLEFEDDEMSVIAQEDMECVPASALTSSR